MEKDKACKRCLGISEAVQAGLLANTSTCAARLREITGRVRPWCLGHQPAQDLVCIKARLADAACHKSRDYCMQS